MNRIGLPLLLGFLLCSCASSPESRLVGVWTAVPGESQLPTIPVPGMDEQAKRYFDLVMLKLRSDGTFLFSSGPPVSGKWTLEGKKLKLKPDMTKTLDNVPKGFMDAFGNQLENFSGTVNADSSRISLEQPTPIGPVVVVLKKTA